TIHQEIGPRADVVMWMHSHLCVGGAQPNVPMVFPQRVEMDCRDLAETLFLHGNIYGELSSWFARRDAVQGLSFASHPLTLDLRFGARAAHRAGGKPAIYWPEPLAVVLIHRDSGSSQAARSGESLPDVIDAAVELSELDWPASTRL